MVSKELNAWHRRLGGFEMFDKLVVSEPDRAGQQNRKSYFMVSSVVVGILFITAVVISIFAEDFGLGSNSFELTEIITPPDLVAAPSERREQESRTRSASALPTRNENMSRTDESQFVPTAISTSPNSSMSRPRDTRFNIGPLNSNSITESTNSNDKGRESSAGPGGGLTDNQSADDVQDIEQQPPARSDPPRNVIRNIGVANGKATFLPKPQYPATAIAIRLEGKVDVQVMIDENGNVTSARAVSGHPFFRSVAEQAAKNARFTPTLLSRVPVKVTGVIVYNFTQK